MASYFEDVVVDLTFYVQYLFTGIWMVDELHAKLYHHRYDKDYDLGQYLGSIDFGHPAFVECLRLYLVTADRLSLFVDEDLVDDHSGSDEYHQHHSRTPDHKLQHRQHQKPGKEHHSDHNVLHQQQIAKFLAKTDEIGLFVDQKVGSLREDQEHHEKGMGMLRSHKERIQEDSFYDKMGKNRSSLYQRIAMAVTIQEALEIIASQKTTPRVQTLCLEEALGQISATDYYASIDLPVFDNSAMDGYAIRLEDAGKEVRVIATVLAGERSDVEVVPHTAVKIMTGAKLPKGCEAIVPIEDVEDLGERVVLPKKIKEKAHMRFAGEDVAKNERIVEKGEMLGAYQIGLLASQGISYVEVYEPPKVVVFATGHELKMHYESLHASQIYNSNTPSLYARAKELGCQVRYLGRIEDSVGAIQEAITAAKDADLIITSGGVSVGEADHTKEAFKAMGMQTLFSKVEIKPGKPTTLGYIGDTMVLNLPGNPLAALLNFELFGRFLINRLSHRKDPYIQPITAKLAEKLTNKPGRDTVIPGKFDGEWFYPLAKRGPGMVRPAAMMDGFIILSHELSSLAKGKSVRFVPLCNLTASEPKELISH